MLGVVSEEAGVARERCRRRRNLDFLVAFLKNPRFPGFVEAVIRSQIS